MFKRFQKDSKSSRPRSGSILAGKRLCQPDGIWPHKLSETITSCCWEGDSETVPTCGPLSALCLRSIPWPVAGLLDHLLNSKHIKTRALDTPPVAFCVFFHPRSCSLSSSLASRKQAFSERPKPYSSDWLAVATVSMQSGVRLNLNCQICLLQIIMTTYQYRDHQLCQKLVE